MSAKHTHSLTKERQHLAVAAALKTKKDKEVVLAPTPMLYSMVVLKDNTRGRIVGYTGAAGSQTYTLRTDFGDLVKFTRADIASYK